MLNDLGYSLQSVRKSREGAVHPDRNAQFEHINATADRYLRRGQPVISVDTKKKELVGDFKKAGREWQPKDAPEHTLVHDFPQDADGKAIPYGVYDMGRNEALVSVGRDHDTPAFAVASLRQWWKQMGQAAYPPRPSCSSLPMLEGVTAIAPGRGNSSCRLPGEISLAWKALSRRGKAWIAAARSSLALLDPALTTELRKHGVSIPPLQLRPRRSKSDGP